MTVTLHNTLNTPLRHILLLLLLIAHLVPLHAKEGQEEGMADSLVLDNVVVTGTRTPKSLLDSPVPTRLISGKDIQRADATDIEDLLRQELPGVEFSYAMNQQTHLNFSGFGGQSILFLVDGERLAGETMDDVDFSRLIMANVSRIEVVKGASSALYGSSAGGGVVNIITKEGGAPWTLHLDSRWSRHGGQRYGIQFGLNRRRWSNTFTATFSDVGNFRVTSDANSVTRTYSEVYGSKVVNVKERLSVNITDAFKLTGRVGYFFRQVPRVLTEPERYRDFSAGLRALWDISSNDLLDIAYSFDQYDKSAKQQAVNLDVRTYSNVQNAVRALYTHSFRQAEACQAEGAGRESGTFVFGFDFMRDYLYNTRLADPRRHQHSLDAFAQYDWNAGERWEMVGALRYDYFSDGRLSRLTPKLSVRHTSALLGGDSGRGVVFRFSYGMGFRAPSLKEKYSEFDMAGIWIVQGNPDLKSELSHNLILSAEYADSKYDFMVMGYYNNVRNKISSGLPVSRSSQLYLPYTNLDRYSVYGAELSARGRWGIVTGKLGYAFTKEMLPSDRDGNTINNQYIPARPHSLTWECAVDKDLTPDYGLSVTLSGRLLSGVDNSEYIDYYDIARGTATIHYPAYSLWKLSIEQRLWQKVRVSLTLDNVFNYKPQYYYLNSPATDGTNLMAGLSVDL